MTNHQNGLTIDCKHEGDYKLVCKECNKSFDEFVKEEDMVMFKVEREGLNMIIRTLWKFMGFVKDDAELLEAIVLLERQRDAIL